MKSSLYFNYASRSLLRGRQRTILAIFCIGVGVMAIVALQLVGFMLQNSLTENARDLNGGDISVNALHTPLSQNDLAVFKQLEHDGKISSYTAFSSANGFLSQHASSFQSITITVVDPATYPVASPPTFVTPGDGQVSTLLGHNQVIATQSFLDRYQKRVGDSFTVYLKSVTGTGQSLHVTISGVVTNSGLFAQAGNLLLIDAHDYQSLYPQTPTSYSTIDITTTDQQQTDAAVKTIRNQFPFASTQTVADVLQTQQASIDTIKKFLEIAGLLALLIGGVGIVNTMNVLLSRRKTEIAMLKTAGYRRLDLYLLFGLEAGLLGLIGGAVGAIAATGVSYFVRNLMQNLGFNVPFVLDPWTIASGVAIGLMPIVQAANIRPLSVIRDLAANKRASGILASIALLLILSVLFCALAIVILNNDVMLGIEAVYGTFAFLLVLSALFGSIVLLISKLPVPERFNARQLALVVGGLAAAALLYLAQPTFGIVLLAVALLGCVIVLLPRSWKISMRMALRNIGRQRTRTTTTLLALFIGVFTIGLVLALGQGLQAQLSTTFVQKLPYNVIITSSGTDTTKLQAHLGTVAGISKSRSDAFVQATPLAINGQPLAHVLADSSNPQGALGFLNTIEGYDITHATPDTGIIQGRNLNASDIATNHVVVNELLMSGSKLHMHVKVGDTITFAAGHGQPNLDVVVVGIYDQAPTLQHIGNILAPDSITSTLASTQATTTTITYLKIDPSQINAAMDAFSKIIPDATVQSLADVASTFSQELNSILSILTAIASLSLLAGVLIIANSVALAMLERRRELGILKSVGYTSGSILSEVVIENGIVGAVGACLALLLATVGIMLLGNMVFNIALATPPTLILELLGGSTLLAVLTAAFVAWNATRFRPLEVLRYE